MIYDTQHQKQKRIHDMFYKLTTMVNPPHLSLGEPN